MKYTLKDYQADAVGEMLERLTEARDRFHVDGEETSVSLSATTGAGKTVMAAAVIESLFYGSDTYEFDLDPGAVVIWFSDDPNLNQQTRTRLMRASDQLQTTDLVTIEAPFSLPKLEAGKVYFLNTQKLTKSSLLTRGHEEPDEGDVLPTVTAAANPDLQGFTIWETIANTINDDDLTLYLIVDEAQRGFNSKKASSDKTTIVRKLVDGHAGYPPVPVVWGISATIARFEEAMEEAHAAQSRIALKPVAVPPDRVQESGLVKDAVVLDIPAEVGNFDTILVERGAKMLGEFSARWEQYAASQELPEVVKPLLVLQAPNTPDDEQIGRALDKIAEVFPDLKQDAVRHVFGDHVTQTFGGWEVEWIEPQRVEDSDWVRVLIAKDAISTGWDCPRAEVLVSFRPAQDHTHITQLLGRMVRNPLARRIPGDERLNSVNCILPFFDRTTAGNVVKFLTGLVDGVPDPRRRKLIIEQCDLAQNPDVPESVWECWDGLPTETVPKRGASPVSRLATLALELSTDKLRTNALAEVKAKMVGVLDDERAANGFDLKKAIAEVWNVRLQRITGKLGDEVLTYEDFVATADDRAIQVAFADANRAFGPDVAIAAVNDFAGDDDDSLREAFVTVSALATVDSAREVIDEEADQMAGEWFSAHSGQIAALSDERRQVFDDILALATKPERAHLGRPRTRIEDYVEVLDDGQLATAPTVDRHLMADENGTFPIGSLNEWEREVVMKELERPDTLAWYRNPPRQSSDSVGIAYRDDGNWRSMHPDFIFFNDVDGKIMPSIVDPHGHHLEDSVDKLKALARFAAEYGDDFHRIEALSKIKDQMRVVDMQDPSVRDAIEALDLPEGKTEEVYSKGFARDYDL